MNGIFSWAAQQEALTEAQIINATEHIDTDRDGYFIRIARAIERAHGIAGPAAAVPEGLTPSIQDVMFEVYEYAKMSDGFDALEGEPRAKVRTAAALQAVKIRTMISALRPASDDAKAAVSEELLKRATKMANASWIESAISWHSLQMVLREVLAAIAASTKGKP